jgi:hypothetical protein
MELSATLAFATVAGSCYLAYLGVRVLKSDTAIEQASGVGRPGRPSTCTSFKVGMGVSALKPEGTAGLRQHPSAVRAASRRVAPARTARRPGGRLHRDLRRRYLPLGVAAERVLGARPRAAHLTTRVAGTSMVLVGLITLGERILAASHS